MRNPRPHARLPPVRIISPRLLAVGLAAGVIAGLAASAAATPPADLGGALTQIQNACFAAYPHRLVARMSGRSGPIPEEIRTNPRLQIRYLKSEARVSKGLFYPSLLEDVLPAFTEAVKPGVRFLDLGSGDGRVVFMAALLGAQAEGVEYDRALHRIAIESRRRLAGMIDPDRAVLRRGDFFEEDLRPYGLFFYFEAGSSLEDRLLEKLRREMNDDAVLILAYPRGPVPGFIRIANHDGVELLRRAPESPGAEPRPPR